MFLKQEEPEMDDFEEEKNFVSKGKILSIFLTLITLQKYHKMFLHLHLHSFDSERSKRFLF